jgi:hypothetical protein
MLFLVNVRAKIDIRFVRGKFGGRSIMHKEEVIGVAAREECKRRTDYLE